MGNVLIRLGNIFDNSSDLVLLPCSAKGTFTKAAREHQARFQIPLPNPMALGGIQIVPFTGSGTITRYVAWCASVLDDASSPSVIERIARQVGEFTRENSNVRLVETPLLGAGHGRLSIEESALALAKGFREHSHPDATLAIFCMHGEVAGELRRSLDALESPKAATDIETGKSASSGSSSRRDKHFFAVLRRFQNSTPKTYRKISLEVCRLVFGPELPDKAFDSLDTLRDWYRAVLHASCQSVHIAN